MTDVPFTSTYRLQLSGSFTLDDARRVSPYLARLGTSHLYLSPVLRSRAGSTHGYDVVDPTEVDPELGGEEAWERLVRTTHALGMGILVDIVPNHMGVGSENPYWEDVFANGPSSRWASWFDIDWDSPHRGLGRRVLVPILGDRLDGVLGRGEIELAYEGGRFRVKYFEHVFPVDPRTVPLLLRASPAAADSLNTDAELAVLADLLDEYARLPSRTATRAGLVERRRNEAPRLRRRLAELVGRSERLRRFIEDRLRDFSSGEGAAARLRRFLDAQVYALVFWRRASHEINYRRFFDINELVALRMEEPEVFSRTHERILEWVRAGDIAGIRIDHVDGLRYPRRYLEKIRSEIDARLPAEAHGAFPVLVEKILLGHERLRAAWPVHGTTGYEFLNAVESIFVAAEGSARIVAAYRKFIAMRESGFGEVAYRGKLQILRGSLRADVQRLTRLVEPIIGRHLGRETRRDELTAAIVQLIACLAVYRTYVDPSRGEVDAEDVRVVEAAAELAIGQGEAAPDLTGLLADLILLRRSPAGTDEEDRRRVAFIERLQQTSGPATAKGVEDTALYRYTPLSSLNEVGGEPDRDIALAVDELHRANMARARDWPRAMSTVETHDTKRSADVRSRIDVLSEIPDTWTAAVERWHRLNEPLRTLVRGRRMPDRNTESLLYQTLAGMWPLGEAGPLAAADVRDELRERVQRYAIKAAREAKTHTSWRDPDDAFEQAVTTFIERLLPAGASPFLDELISIVGIIGPSGLWNALSRTLIHLTAPGIPDLYQGAELWNFALVDPDNRRPVDFEVRERTLDALERGGHLSSADGMARSARIRQLVEQPWDPHLKLLVVHRALKARRDNPELFASGAYEPLRAGGRAAGHVFAFARRHGRQCVIAAVPRLVRSLTGGTSPLGPEAWSDTSLHAHEGAAGSEWRSLLTGERIGDRLSCADLFATLPVALLERVAD